MAHAANTKRPWAMKMVWSELAFLHWAVDPDALRPSLPVCLQDRLDTFEGKAYLGVVPFWMSGVRGRGLPAVPGLSSFPELNLRTYIRPRKKGGDVVGEDRAINGATLPKDDPLPGGLPGAGGGVWFYSLDAGHRLAVRTARATFGLPYFDAKMSMETLEGERVRYRSQRTHKGALPAVFDGVYEPTDGVFQSQPGSLEHWLTERYCLYAMRRGKLVRGDIDHVPWPLQEASCDLKACDMARLAGVDLVGPPVSVLYAKHLEVKAWLPRVETVG